jgi:hypothetical protein
MLFIFFKIHYYGHQTDGTQVSKICRMNFGGEQHITIFSRKHEKKSLPLGDLDIDGRIRKCEYF